MHPIFYDPETGSDISFQLISYEVITETDIFLGWIREFRRDPNDAQIYSVILGTFNLPFLPDSVVSTYQLSIAEIISTGEITYYGPLTNQFAVGRSRCLVVFEGAKDRLQCLTHGILERLGIPSFPLKRLFSWHEQNDRKQVSLVTRDFHRDFYRDDDEEWFEVGQSFDNEDDATGGVAPSPRPRKPTPNPLVDESAIVPDSNLSG